MNGTISFASAPLAYGDVIEQKRSGRTATVIMRLSIVTGLIAMFAMSFSVLATAARHDGTSFGQGSSSCLSSGLMCAPQGSART